MRILIVEDEKNLADALAQILKKNNYSVDLSYDGESGLDNALTGIYDLILLDIMLPKVNGLKVLEEIRKEKIATPVLLLTAKSEISDRVIGLDRGADDYLTKPFASEELLARIRAISRRKGEIVPDEGIRLEDLTINKTTLLMSYREKEVKLTLKESEIMELLVLRRHMITSKELLIEKLWGYDTEVEYNNVEVYISFLRKKLTYLEANVTITTTRGVGYGLEVKQDV